MKSILQKAVGTTAAIGSTIPLSKVIGAKIATLTGFGIKGIEAKSIAALIQS